MLFLFRHCAAGRPGQNDSRWHRIFPQGHHRSKASDRRGTLIYPESHAEGGRIDGTCHSGTVEDGPRRQCRSGQTQEADGTGPPNRHSRQEVDPPQYPPVFHQPVRGLGIDMPCVMEWVAHDELKLVLHYDRLRDEHAKKAMGRFSDNPSPNGFHPLCTQGLNAVSLILQLPIPDP